MNNTFGTQLPNNELPDFLKRAKEFKAFCEEIDDRLRKNIAGGIQFVRDDLSEAEIEVEEGLEGLSLVIAYEKFCVEHYGLTFTQEEYETFMEGKGSLEISKKERAIDNINSGRCHFTIAVTFPTHKGFTPTTEWGVNYDDGQNIQVSTEILDIIEYKFKELGGRVISDHVSKGRNRGLTSEIIEIEFSD